MKTIHVAIAVTLLAVSAYSTAQSASSRQEPPDTGAVAPPPASDPGIVKKPPENIDPKAIHRPPENIDPGIVQKPPRGTDPETTRKNAHNADTGGTGRRQDGRAGKAAPKKESLKDDCKGSADLCKQESPR